jgi:hypothetical protein
MRRTPPQEKPVLEIIAPIAQGGEFFSEDLRIIGGIATTAALAESSQIDSITQTVTLPRTEFKETNIRLNGSLRDLDALALLGRDDPELTILRERIDQQIGGDLVVNIFGLRSIAEWQSMNSVGKALVPRGGDRYKTPDDKIMKLSTPWAIEIPKSSFEPWQYTFEESDDEPEMTFLGLNPANDLVNRLTRTPILRPRDMEKIANVLTLVENNPALSDWLKSGDGQSQLELAKIALSVRANSWHSLTPRDAEKARAMNELSERLTSFVGGTYSPDELAEHKAFMFKDLSDRKKAFLIGEAAAVRAPIHWLIETGILDIYQKLDMENWPIIRNFT